MRKTEGQKGESLVKKGQSNRERERERKEKEKETNLRRVKLFFIFNLANFGQETFN